MPKLTSFSFGSTSAVITCLALIASRVSSDMPKSILLGSLLIIAVADNISDMFGIHMYQDSSLDSKNDVWSLTATNFIARLVIMLIFIAGIIFLPAKIDLIFSIIFGLTILVILSILIAMERKLNPTAIVLKHLLMAVIVVSLSGFLTHLILDRF